MTRHHHHRRLPAVRESTAERLGSTLDTTNLVNRPSEGKVRAGSQRREDFDPGCHSRSLAVTGRTEAQSIAPQRDMRGRELPSVCRAPEPHFDPSIQSVIAAFN